MLEILLWAVGLIGAYIIYAIFSGMKREDAYCAAIRDIKYELTINPNRFFSPYHQLGTGKFISYEEVMIIALTKVTHLALERKIRYSFNANVIPSDITTLPTARQDFENLVKMAYFLANDDN